MALVKISELPAASSLTGTELYPFVQSGNTKKGAGGGSGRTLRSYGAALDGVTDDYAAWNAALVDLPLSGGTLNLGQGTSAVNSDITLPRPNLTIQGDSWATTSIKAGAAHNVIFQTSGSPPNRGNVRLCDLTIDMNYLVPAGVTLYPDDITWSFERVRFKGNSSYAVILNGCSNVTFTDCIFEGNGHPQGTEVILQSGASRIKFTRCRFRYHKNGIIMDTNSVGATQTEKQVSNVVIDNCVFDSAWWLLRAQFANSGGTVTYTSTVLTDTAAAFSGIAAPAGTNVRAMAVLETGTSGNANFFYNRLTDPTATFVTAGVRRGHILRAGTTFAVVANVESETTLWVEEWLSDTDRSIVGPPYSTAYTIYGVVIGLVTAYTGTTITVDRWHDLTGATVLPTAGTRYEVMYGVPNYNLHSEYSAKKITVISSTFRRGWSDQVSLYGFQNTVDDCDIEDGQDFGIIIHGQENIVTSTRVRHQGAQGISVDGNDSVISNNVATDTPWVNITANTGDLAISGSRNVVSGNVARSGGLAHHRFGMIVAGVAGVSAVDNLLANNSFTGYATADLKLTAHASGSQTRTKLYDNVYATSAIEANVTAIDYGKPSVIDIDAFSTPVSSVNFNDLGSAACIYGGRRASTGAQNDEVVFQTHMSPGTWTWEIMMVRDTAAGIFNLFIDNVLVGTIDGYGAFLFNWRLNASGIVVQAGGNKLLKVRMATKNASATNYYGYIQHMQLRRTA